MGNPNTISTKKKILFIGNQAMALYKFRLGIMLALQNFGFEIYAIAPPDQYSQKLRDKGVHFRSMKMAPHKKNPIADLLFFIKLFFLYKSIKPDLIFHYTIKPNIYGTIAAKILGIPSFSIVPGRGHSFHKQDWLYHLVKRVYAFSLKHSISTWFLNEEDREYFVEKGIVQYDKTLILPGEGVNTTYYSPSRFPQKSNQGKTTFLLYGRLLWEKGVGVFVEAARLVKKEYPNTLFILLGFLDDSDTRVVPKKTIAKWEKEKLIQYVGEVEDVRPILSKTDCFVLPSFYGEGLPRSLMEAASMEVPLITTDHVGCRRAVENGINGFICQPKDPIDLANKIKSFIELSAKEKNIMGSRGRQMMQNKFEEDIIVEIYLKQIGQHFGIELLESQKELELNDFVV